MKKTRFYFDRHLLIPSLLLIALGLLMVTSASMSIAERQYQHAFHFLFRQGIYVCLSLAFATIIIKLPIDFWRRISGYLVLAAILLLMLVLIPGIGREINGSMRWINLGLVNLQVSEVTKMAFIIYLAAYLERRQQEVQQRWSGFLKPLLVLAVINLLLLQQPDFGSVAVLTATTLLLLFLARARLVPFLLLLVLATAALTLLIFIAPYRLLRLTTFLHPWAHQFESGYQLTQALIAFGRGGLFGVGLGNSVQKLFYLPEAHTDFLFAVIGEELGLWGECLIIGLFIWLISRLLWRAKGQAQQQHFFHAYLGWGIAFSIGLQAFINMGVNCGLLPTKGLTLPLLSYGGSSMLVNCSLLSIGLRLSFESWRQTRQGIKQHEH